MEASRFSVSGRFWPAFGVFFAAFLALLAWGVRPASADDSAKAGPSGVVDHLEKAFGEVSSTKGGASQSKGAHALVPAVSGTHDLSRIAERIAGKKWDAMEDKGQRGRMTQALAGLLASAYEKKLEGHADAAFQRGSVENSAPSDCRIEDVMKDARGAETHVAFSLHRAESGWRITGCSIGGEDVVASVVDRYGKVAQERDFAGLLAVMEGDHASTPAAPAGEETAKEVVQRLWDGLLSVMKEAKALGYKGRYKRLQPVIETTHDLDGIARVALGRYWKKLSPDQQKEFLSTFHDLSIATYAARFDGYSGETFEIVSSKDIPGRFVGKLVQALLHKQDGGKVHFDYILHKVDGKWRILNIVADGVSDLSMKRSEYSSVMARDGFKGLLAKLKKQTADYEADKKD